MQCNGEVPRTSHHLSCKTEYERLRDAHRLAICNRSACRYVCLSVCRVSALARFTSLIARPDFSNRAVYMSRQPSADRSRAKDKKKTSRRTSHVRQFSAHSPQLGLALLVLPQLLVLTWRQPHDHAHHERIHLKCQDESEKH